jgi:hypothetical protein
MDLTRQRITPRALDAEGLSNVIVVYGGLERWTASGMPLLQSRQWSVLPVTNQVQVSIGALLVMTTMLALALHPLWLLLTTVVGVGRIYAGITRSRVLEDWLWMVPWNRGGSRTQAV